VIKFGDMILPENLSHIIRLERAVQLAVASRTVGKRHQTPSPREIEKQLVGSEELLAIAHREDPPEGMFTENITFYGGNHIIYPGNGEAPAHTLQLLLRAAFLTAPEEVRDALGANAYRTVHAMLLISDAIAQRMGHERWNAGVTEATPSIYVPARVNDFDRVARAVTFTRSELNSMLGPLELTSADLTPFVINPAAVNLDIASELSPLHAQPLLQTGDGIIVVHPCSIVSAIRHFIMATAHTTGIVN